jgi:4-diphosphocytidyl-2C-methyl-D-erythritol kinase
MAIVVKYHLCALVLTMNSQVISLGDTIKFSLSPSKSRDRLSTNVPGVPVDESNLV